MDINDFQEELFNKGQEFGFSDMEVSYSNNRSISVSVLKQQIDTYTIRENGLLSFRGVIDGKMGFSSTQKLEVDSIEFLLNEARANSEIVENEEMDELFSGSDQYPEIITFYEKLVDTDPKDLIEAALLMERIALEEDSRISLVKHCAVGISEFEELLVNTKGLNCHQKNSFASAGIQVLGRESEETVTGFWYDYSIKDFKDIHFESIAKKAVEEAVSRFHAETIKSGNYPVILRNDAASDLIAAFASSVSAESVDKGFSRLKGKIGEKVANSNISILDNPLMENVPGSGTFDAEGSATTCTDVIKEGKLLTYLHNRKTAKKAGVANTANAAKNRGMIGVSYHNLYILPGNLSLQDMIKDVKQGLMIAELQGINAGVNVVSGNFSLSCVGYLIENGKIIKPVDQITVSGNFFEILNDIEEVGEDLKFYGNCSSPSLKIKSLSISGD